MILTDYLNDLRKRVNCELRTDDYSRVLYSTDASIYQIMPLAVLLPRSPEDVQAAIELAANYRIPILARTGGSSLVGQAVNEAVIIDFTPFLNNVLEVNSEEKWVCVQPGLVLDVLNQHLQSYGLQFGPDPASSNRAALGGIVANNSTGSHSIIYGMTADHVLETDVFLSDGSKAIFKAQAPDILKQKQKLSGIEGRLYKEISHLISINSEVIKNNTPKHWRRSGGYNLDRFVEGPSFNYPQKPGFNLASLVCGSEGTLAIMHKIKLNLVERPKKTALAVIQFHSIYEALSATPVILEVEPTAVELLDNLGLTLCRNVPAYARLLRTFIQGEPNCLLITEFYGENENELEAKLNNLIIHLKKNSVNAQVVKAIAKEMQQNIWNVRKVGLGLMMSIKGDHKPIPFIEDAAVPPIHLADYVTHIEKFCNDLGTKVAYYAHASAGCIHIRPLINTKVATEVEKLPVISKFSIELLGKYDGVLSSEHGDGRARSWLNEIFFGKDLYNLFKQVKNIFDPENIFNPGIITDGQDMRINLRYGSDYNVIPVEEKYDFSEDQGFHRAVEMCNGAGICRKTTVDTMCPSFMVTLDEKHSTRGRANALRAALSGFLKPQELTSKRMFEVMDLCIMCKACKAECPSSVDMAKIKSEFLAQYYKKNRIPFRTKVFAEIGNLGKLVSGTSAGFVNGFMDSAPIRFLLDSGLGITKKRSLPKFSNQPFTEWYKIYRSSIKIKDTRHKVVLYNDTFNNYYEPHVLIAAVELLEAANFEVIVPEHKECARPMISKGMLDKARKIARSTVDILKDYAQNNIPIIGLEPSSLLTFRDEYLSLLPGDENAKLVADNSFLIEEFFCDHIEKGLLKLKFSNNKQKILLHGNCHQKSMIGTNPVKQILNLPENYMVEEIDSGCCGMAGSFGYEKEHYDISMKMAERRLLPAVRKQEHDTLIVACGFSCRQQIRHGTGRNAFHPVEILNRALV